MFICEQCELELQSRGEIYYKRITYLHEQCTCEFCNEEVEDVGYIISLQG